MSSSSQFCKGLRGAGAPGRNTKKLPKSRMSCSDPILGAMQLLVVLLVKVIITNHSTWNPASGIELHTFSPEAGLRAH